MNERTQMKGPVKDRDIISHIEIPTLCRAQGSQELTEVMVLSNIEDDQMLRLCTGYYRQMMGENQRRHTT
jgi:hypothetical protein